MYKQDLVINNPQGLICHKHNQPTNQVKESILKYHHVQFSNTVAEFNAVLDRIRYNGTVHVMFNFEAKNSLPV